MTPDINTGKPWSEMDLCDLENCIERGDSIEQIAEFLCRDREEILAQIKKARPPFGGRA